MDEQRNISYTVNGRDYKLWDTGKDEYGYTHWTIARDDNGSVWSVGNVRLKTVRKRKEAIETNHKYRYLTTTSYTFVARPTHTLSVEMKPSHFYHGEITSLKKLVEFVESDTYLTWVKMAAEDRAIARGVSREKINRLFFSDQIRAISALEGMT